METKNWYIIGAIVFILGIIVGFAILYSVTLFKSYSGSQMGGGTVCPALARLCPDGSYSTPSGPNCESKCPGEAPTITPVSGGPSADGQINCPTGYYASVGNPDEGWKCFKNGTMHTL